MKRKEPTVEAIEAVYESYADEGYPENAVVLTVRYFLAQMAHYRKALEEIRDYEHEDYCDYYCGCGQENTEIARLALEGK